MNLRLKRTPGVYLVGFMGSGKSTVGRQLAQRLGWCFHDIDEEIEKAEGVTIPEIFELRGEEEFRRIECETIREHVRRIESGRPAVLSLGGGAFVDEGTRALLAENGISIWLDISLAVAQERVAVASNRPLARDPERFAALYTARREVYRLADVRVAVETETPMQVVDTILGHSYFR